MGDVNGIAIVERRDGMVNVGGKAIPGKYSAHQEVALELRFCAIAVAKNHSSAT